MQEMEIAGQKLNGEAVQGFSFDIKTDGTYKMTGMDVETGSWILSDKGDSLITTKDKGNVNSIAIQELSETKLILAGSSEGASMVMSFVPAAK